MGKSFLMLEFARALASKGRLFECDRFNVPETPRILMIEQELGEYLLASRVRSVFNGTDLAAAADKIWFVSKEQAVKLHLPEGRALIRRWCSEIQPNILILDPIGKMHNYDENSNSEIAKLFYFFDELRQENRPRDMSLIVAHHFNKPDVKFKRDDLDLLNFRGASKFTDDPDSVITVKRTLKFKGKGADGKAYRWWRGVIRFAKLRAGEEPPDMLLTWNEFNDGRVRFKAEIQDKED